MDKDFTLLEKNIGIKFKDIKLLNQALVHRSYLNENTAFKLDNNERLEFLGDAVLELVVTQHLYKNYSNPEGDLTNWRSALVNTNMLSKQAKALDYDSFLYLSRGEAKDTGKARDVILANAFEAVIGAIYLDQGWDVAKDFIERKIIAELKKILDEKLYIDPKSRLQEEIQEKLKVTPTYQVLKEWGPDHARKFKIGVYLEDKLLGEGEGDSKQEAQVNAAKNALEREEWKK
ncbi:MAG: ribonuclease III [Patescibacteria group bacterium]|nr:ribonuclease III [Patescibacteria group bacterium]